WSVHVFVREHLLLIVEVVQPKPELLQVVLALRPRRRLADFLHGRQEQADQNGDDRDYHQQFDQREPSLATSFRHIESPMERKMKTVWRQKLHLSSAKWKE